MSRGDARISRSVAAFVFMSLPLGGPWFAASLAQSPASQPTTQPEFVSGQEMAHWSGMPIWGAKEARELGYELPLPIGVAGTMFSETANFNVSHVSIGHGGGLLSIDPLVRINNVRISETAWTVRPDVWVLPFLDLYGIAGYVNGHGNVDLRPGGLPAAIARFPKYDLHLQFEGPTVGVGGTLAGGFKPFGDRSTIVFGLTDLNFTRTFLDFRNVVSTLDSVDVMVFSSRLGVRERIVEKSPLGEIYVSVWGGGMYQRVQDVMSGSVAGLIDFSADVDAVNPWNTLIGGRVEIGRNTVLTVEGGLGDRRSLMVELGIRF